MYCYSYFYFPSISIFHPKVKVKRGWQVVKGCTVLSGRSGIPTVCPWACPRALLPAHLISEARELWSFVMWMSMAIAKHRNKLMCVQNTWHSVWHMVNQLSMHLYLFF